MRPPAFRSALLTLARVSRTAALLYRPLACSAAIGICLSAPGCRRAASFKAIPEVEARGEEGTCGTWLLAGPFAPSRGMSAADASASEPSPSDIVSASGFQGFVNRLPQGGGQGQEKLPRAAVVHRKPGVDFHRELRCAPIFEREHEVFFSGCIFKCSRPTTLYALLECRSRATIWIGGKKVLNTHTPGSPDQNVSVVPLVLDQGPNFVLLRVEGINESAGFALTLEPTLENAVSALMRNADFLLPHRVWKIGESPTFRVPLSLDPPPRFNVSVTSADHPSAPSLLCASKGCQGTLDPPLGYSEGLYLFEISLGGNAQKIPFLMGDPAREYDRLKPRMRACVGSDALAINLDALAQRMEILLAPRNRNDADLLWQEKIAYTLFEIADLLSRVESGREAFKGVPGLHLRGFRSEIDGQVQHFRIAIPPSYNDRPPGIPLLVMLPTVVSASRPFIASAFVADQVAAEHLARIAAKSGAAVLWPGYRCEPTGNPCEFTHLDEALRAACRDYTIDPHRIALLGTCSSGITAEMSALAYPGRFSGIGVLNGKFSRTNIYRAAADGPNVFENCSAYLDWLRRTDPLDRFVTSGGTPMLALNDGGGEKGHGEARYSAELAERTRTWGRPVTVEITREAYRFPSSWERIIHWAVSQYVDFPSDYRTSDEETVAGAFAAPFVVVEGTSGTAAERAAVSSLSKRFQETWLRVHFVTCPVTSDTALASADERRLNLVLIGNERLNRIWSKYASKIPVRISPKGIGMDRKWTAGKGLSLQAVIPSPENPGRRVVLIGADDICGAQFDSMELSTNGWYRYAIWSPDSQGSDQPVDIR